MAKTSDAAKSGDEKKVEGVEANLEGQAREQVGQQQIRLQIDEREMSTSCANAFRSNGTAEEVIIDFGFNTVTQQGQQPVITFKINDRVVMNYYSAKRLAITLSQLIRRHEDAFGVLELDVNKRRKIAK